MRPRAAGWLLPALALLARVCADYGHFGVEDGLTVRVTGAAPDAGEALAQLAARALRSRGVQARVQPPPRACLAAPHSALCRDAVLRALAAGACDAALLALPAAEPVPAPRLRDIGLEELGDAAPPLRRACLATRPPLRSLLDLADARLAAHYYLPDGELPQDSGIPCEDVTCKNTSFVPDRCTSENSTCAMLLTSDANEVSVLAAMVRRYALHARVLALGAALATVGAQPRPLLLCDRAPAFAELAELRAEPLGPPPCRLDEHCPFEPYRLVKLANVRKLTRSPTALRVLAHLRLDAQELRELISGAHVDGAEAAAEAYLDAHPQIAPIGEVRTAVLLPANTSRRAYDAGALVAAAALAEEDLAAARVSGSAHFKVELSDDGCAAPGAYKYLSDALGTGEYGSLSAVAGPACGVAFADVARLSPAHVLPVLAYTPQAAPPAPGAALALLGAGDSRHEAAALAALLAALGWRRLAVLSEPATRPVRAALDHTLAPPDIVVHVELPDSGVDFQHQHVDQWIERVVLVNARILYLCVEDARAVRAALCAGQRAGLTPGAGAVWVLPRAPPSDWLDAAPGERCDREQLRVMAEGHLRLAPAWQAEWQQAPRAHAAWRTRWRARCLARGAKLSSCRVAPPHAALLYDVLRLWALALDGLLAANPAALDDLHRPDLVQFLIQNATSTNFTGLTGKIEWSSEDGVLARNSSLVVQQWWNGTGHPVGRWRRGGLALAPGALRWATAGGRAPDDGREHCALQALAELLRCDCRTALLAPAALLLCALLAALGALALHCRRRAELEHRARLAALDMRALGGGKPGLDRWELPRERVVINRKLGTGAFGTVYGGHALLSEERGWTAVAVKTLKPGATTEEKLDFLSEAEAMKSFDHKNVVRLLGVVTKTAPVCTVMEFMLYGDLKNYLLARRHLAAADAPEEEEVSARQLTSMALDAARALSYLAQLRYVHRDVAARNCLVSARRVVKLADFGMTRLVFENDYYRLSRKGMLPVRWMAPESLELGVFSPASDVWSFGVLLYEIVTFGSLPFQGLSNSEVLVRVKRGHTLELPAGLKPQLEGLIKSCWQKEQRRRPAAAEVAAFLADAPRLLAPCLGVPLDALALDEARWRLPADVAEARWVSWTAPPSAATDATYLSADAPPADTDAFLPT